MAERGYEFDKAFLKYPREHQVRSLLAQFPECYVCYSPRFAGRPRVYQAGPDLPGVALEFAKEHLPNPDIWAQDRTVSYEVMVCWRSDVIYRKGIIVSAYMPTEPV